MIGKLIVSVIINDKIVVSDADLSRFNAFDGRRTDVGRSTRLRSSSRSTSAGQVRRTDRLHRRKAANHSLPAAARKGNFVVQKFFFSRKETVMEEDPVES